MSAKELAEKKINEARELINQLDDIKINDKSGVQKLRKKIQSEIKFLEKCLKCSHLKEEHIQSSNIGQLSALVTVALNTKGVIAILKAFVTNGKKVSIDIVAENGKKWLKVILRNPKAIHELYLYGRRDGARPLHEVAQDILSIAEAHPVLFVPPKVCFYLEGGVSDAVVSSLSELCVEVVGERVTLEQLGLAEEVVDFDEQKGNRCSKDSNLLEETDKLESIPELDFEYNSVNLDVSCLIACVSATSNGRCYFKFKNHFLNEQAAAERERPVKNILNAYFKGRRLLVCESAAERFKSILCTVGGPGEQERGHELIQRCCVVPDEDIFQGVLCDGGRVKSNSRRVFGTGERLRAPTVTANAAFVRAVRMQGVSLAVLNHEPRALTELKEETASPLLPNG